jgi:hypothetical protein
MPLRVALRPTIVTLSVTSAAVAASVAITQLTLWWVGHGASTLPAMLAGAVPAVMVPLMVFPRANATWRLKRVQSGPDRITSQSPRRSAEP